MGKYNRKLIEGAIISYFGSKKKCAKALGFSESTLSRNLKNLPEPFIQRLKGIGVVFGDHTLVRVSGMKDNASSKQKIDSEKAYVAGESINQVGILADRTFVQALVDRLGHIDTVFDKHVQVMGELREEVGKLKEKIWWLEKK